MKLESRIEKLEAKTPAPQTGLRLSGPFDPEDFCGNIAAMNAAIDNAIDKAQADAAAHGEQLIAMVAVPAIGGRPKYPEQLSR